MTGAATTDIAKNKTKNKCNYE